MSDTASPRPEPPFEAKPIPYPGRSSEMQPPPDHGEHSYVGSEQLAGKVALITGGGFRHRPRGGDRLRP